MKKATTTTIGCDLGDKYSHVCVLDNEGEVVEATRVRTTRKGLKDCFGGRSRARVAIEVGTHSRWVDQMLRDLGHEVLVANAREIRLIWGNKTKRDQVDAESLARLARVDTKLLKPITHRSQRAHADLSILHARDGLVRGRSKLICKVRGMVKATGSRIPSCDAKNFHGKAELIPEELWPALGPIMETIGFLSDQIHEYDKLLERKLDEHPHTHLLLQVKGVGPVTALAYVLVVCDPSRFVKSRDAAPYFGLVRKRDQSGDRDPELGITKAGNHFVRRLLVQCAHYILGPFGPDTDLRRFGERIASRGGKNAKKRAAVAVARKLAVLLHRLWVTAEVYEPVGYADKRVAA